MKLQQYGRIITLSGGGADRPLTHMTIYSASKGGVVAFSKCLAEELKANPEDIKLNLYLPGMFKTGLTSGVKPVPNWNDQETLEKDTDIAIGFMGGNISKSTAKVIPYVLPSCKDTGKLFRGFSLPKLILGAMKLQKYMKNQS